MPDTATPSTAPDGHADAADPTEPAEPTADEPTADEPTADELARLDAYWRAANYLTVGQIYLQDNPLLREPLRPEHIKPRLLGHWGTSPGLSLLYTHLNRVIRRRGVDVLFVCGPGHGGPAIVANVYLEGTWSEIYDDVTQDEDGLRRLFRQFSTPGGIPSHVSVPVPGSIHEGGELGYALIHAVGAVFDAPDRIAACVIGDGEAETAPLEGSWKGVRFLNPARDGAVLPVLHLNGYKIANPTVLGRASDDQIHALLTGHGYDAVFVEGDDPETVHRSLSTTLDRCFDRLADIQRLARADGVDAHELPAWPALVLRTPKGWTGPSVVDGVQIEGTFRAHQVPVNQVRTNPDHLTVLEDWMQGYHPEELFDETGRLRPDLRDTVPEGDRRMGANPAANGGRVSVALDLPDFTDYAIPVPAPAVERHESTRVLGALLRDVFAKNTDAANFRLFSPDELTSNRLGAVLDVEHRTWLEPILPTDDRLAPDGRVMEVLSEHLCQGWLEGYTLTGRHGLFATYEAFAMVSASMLVQHAKWLDHANDLGWRRPVPSLNLLLTSTCWRNDHNGFSHQGPGLIDIVMSRNPDIARVYLPPDANCLLSVADHCLRSRDYVNLIVIDKQPQLQYLDARAAIEHCSRGASMWRWASTFDGDDPDIVLACAGDVMTMETVAAAAILRRFVPDLRVRVVNVVDLMTLLPANDHPHGMDLLAFNDLFTRDRHVVFAFHGYPRGIHQLVHGQGDSGRFHVRGYLEEGTTTTPFDMVVKNRVSRYHLVEEALRRARRRPHGSGEALEHAKARLAAHELYVVEHLEDMPHLRDWTWPAATSADGGRGAPTPQGRYFLTMRLLVVNVGSRTVKLRVLDLSSDADEVLVDRDLPADPDDAEIVTFVEAAGDLDAVVHRVVHGGPDHRGATRVDDHTIDDLRALGDLAPLHNPPAVRMIERVRTLAPGLAAYACFDTAFHADLPEAAATYAVPWAWTERHGLRRYGFHGLSHAHASRRAAELAGADPADVRVVSCHLGGGASLAAVSGGRSVDTTMGFTPLEGLVMATRSGSVDPGLVLWLITDAGLSADEVADGLNHAAGLAGVSGVSDDPRVLLEAADGGDHRAALALAVYVHRLRKELAGMAAAMAGLDLLVFTGGVGEHSAPVRQAAADGLGFLGVGLDRDANRQATGDRDVEITAPGARVRAFVVPAREDLEMARQVRAVAGG